MNELLTTSEMGEADRLTIAGGRAGIVLMEVAGRAVADAVAALRPAAAAVTVVCGPGNNGGDGFVAARILAGWGWRVSLLLLGERERLRGDAALAAAAWPGPVSDAVPDALGWPDVIVDAVFGAGLARPVEGLARALIEAINARRCPVVAVDLPSGVNGDTGQVMGAAVKASHTVTFFRRKPGHLLLPGRLLCGAVACADIGNDVAALSAIAPRLWANGPALWGEAFPVPRLDGHKYKRGHTVVVSGGQTTTGAARLSARGALRAGAGLVTLASPSDALAINAAAHAAVMVRVVDAPADLARQLEDRRFNAVVVGPGGGVGERMCAMVEAVLAAGRTAVLDADALTSFAGQAERLRALLQRNAAAQAVLTPHDGEFARLFGGHGEIGAHASKVERTRAAARYLNAVVVLKGGDSVIAAPDGRAAITENAPAWLATAGSGDVLAGFVAGLAAQGMPAFEAACAATWLHGEAGTQFGPGLISEDLPEQLPAVYRRLFAALAEKERRASLS